VTKTGSTRSPSVVLFDIDGTLVNPSYVHINAWEHAFRAVGHLMAAWRIHRGQEMGSSELLATLLGEASDEVSSQATQHHSERYRQSSELLRL
jgi:phosphoglycolate phosphatase-like HAD superfamily hydrolase